MAQSWKGIGERVAAARATLDLTQAELGEVIGLERTAITKIERGQRKLDALELSNMARALQCSVGWLLDPSELPVVVSHRGAAAVRTLVDARADSFARDVASLIALGVLAPPPAVGVGFEVADPQGGERAAKAVREHLGVGGTPVTDVVDLAERMGLYVACERLGADQPEGCTIALAGAGAALLNGSHAHGRQRFTLAHEIGHHVLQDPYSIDWAVFGADEREKVINAFAIHLLLPRDGVSERWGQLVEAGVEPRGRALTIAAEFGVSWSAALAQLERFGLLTPAELGGILEPSPRRGDFEELGLSLPEHVPCPSLSRGLVVAVLKAYRRRKVSSGRACELLRNTRREDDLPVLTDPPLDALWADVP